jgi:hypothetical protein
MRRILISAATTVIMLIGLVGPATANPPNAACTGLDRAHHQIHESGTQGELTLHDQGVINDEQYESSTSLPSRCQAVFCLEGPNG